MNTQLSATMPELAHVHSPALVALSVIIAMIASYTALDLADRVRAAAGRVRALWIAGGAAAMGAGIWTMHFVGILALHLPLPVEYNGALVTASIAIAIVASAVALWTIGHESSSRGRLAAAAVAMGIGIIGMHYTGMAAMEMDARLTYRKDVWWAAIGFAVVVSYVSVTLARALHAGSKGRVRAHRAAAATMLSLAVAGTHYTVVAAARFVPTRHHDLDALAIPAVALVVAVATGGLLVLGIALVAAMVDRLIHEYTASADLRAAKEAAELTNRAKSEFLSNMSHELRTPLNSVIGFANVLLKNKQGNFAEQDLAYLGRIVANGRHLLGLINGILDLSKIEAGRVELEMAPVDVVGLVRSTVLELEGQTQGRNVVLVAEAPASLEPVTTDATKLKQILINLVGNALKFTHQGSVTVRVVRDDATGALARIDVVDTGIGIPPHRLEAVFEAFQQADSGTSRQYGGTGLGLTITRSLAQLMGFDVTVASREGHGSTFSIVANPWNGAPRAGAARPGAAAAAVAAAVAPVVVPVAPLGPAASVKAVPGTAATAGARSTGPDDRVRRPLALIIDDDADARTLLGQQLIELGWDVVYAASADDGLVLARRVRPDLITMDIMMPRKGGIEALREFKATADLRDIPVVMVSVVAEDYRSRVLGAVECLEKPVTRDALADVLRRATAASPPPRILVVHNAKVDGSRYRDLLKATGAPIELAAGADGARRVVAEHGAPGVIVLDVDGSTQDALESLAAIRDDRSTLGVPVVVVVPAASVADAQDAFTDGATVLARGDDLRSDLRDVLIALTGRGTRPADATRRTAPGLTAAGDS